MKNLLQNHFEKEENRWNTVAIINNEIFDKKGLKYSNL